MARSMEMSINYEHCVENEEGEDVSHEVEIHFEMEKEPDEHNYGADADGNRGVFMAGGFFTETDPPYRCDECKQNFTDDERREIEKQMSKFCDDYVYEP